MTYLNGGLEALSEYLSAHVLSCLIPAFFIAGAIAVFVNQSAVLKYFGPKANKIAAYGVASVSGTILAVCSCTILPLFAGIRQRGAGLGPAIAFLYSGPAINILAVIYSARLLGIEIGFARAVGAVSFSVIIGLMMAGIFHRQEMKMRRENGEFILSEDDKKHSLSQISAFFALLAALLISASFISLVIKLVNSADGHFVLTTSGKPIPAILAILLLAAIIWLTVRWFDRVEISNWMGETWKLLKKIVPILLAGVFIAGIINKALPEATVQKWVGGNSLANNLLAAVFGALMYFSTLTEVPIVKALMDLGMGKGPALTLLLAGPSLSLPNMLVIGRVMGLKRTVVYVILVIILSTMVGTIYGAM